MEGVHCVFGFGAVISEPVAQGVDAVLEVQIYAVIAVVSMEGGQLSLRGGMDAQLIDVGIIAAGGFVEEFVRRQKNTLGTATEEALEFRLLQHAALPFGVVGEGIPVSIRGIAGGVLENVDETPLFLGGTVGGEPVADGLHLVFAKQAVGVLTKALDQMLEPIFGGGIDAQLVHGPDIDARHAR